MRIVGYNVIRKENRERERKNEKIKILESEYKNKKQLMINNDHSKQL